MTNQTTDLSKRLLVSVYLFSSSGSINPNNRCPAGAQLTGWTVDIMSSLSSAVWCESMRRDIPRNHRRRRRLWLCSCWLLIRLLVVVLESSLAEAADVHQLEETARRRTLLPRRCCTSCLSAPALIFLAGGQLMTFDGWILCVCVCFYELFPTYISNIYIFNQYQLSCSTATWLACCTN